MKEIKVNSEAAEKAAIANLDKSKKKQTQKSKSNLNFKKSKLNKKKEQFKKLTGRKRVKKEEAKALEVITAKQLAKQLTKTKEQIEATSKRRLKAFEKTYGEATEEQKKLLTYATASQVAKIYSIEKQEKEETKNDEEEKAIEEAKKIKEEKLSEFRQKALSLSDFHLYYDDLPEHIKKWPHGDNSFIYNNTIYDEDGFDLDDLVDGGDHKVNEFLEDIFSNMGQLKGFVYDPEGLYDKSIEQDLVYSKSDYEEYKTWIN